MVGHDDFQDSAEIDIDWGVVVFEDFHDSWSLRYDVDHMQNCRSESLYLF